MLRAHLPAETPATCHLLECEIKQRRAVRIGEIRAWELEFPDGRQPEFYRELVERRRDCVVELEFRIGGVGGDGRARLEWLVAQCGGQVR